MLEHSLFRFLLVGGVITSAHYILLIVLVEFINVDAVVASSFSMFLGSIGTFILNAHWSFKRFDHKIRRLLRHVLVALVAWVVNFVCLYIGVDIFHYFYLLVQVVATVLVVFWTYLASRFFTFSTIEQLGPNEKN